jgi:hypothetical protein
MEKIRIIKKTIEKTINLLNLDLKGETVLTEAANGHFFVTPVIAALAGAKVIAVTRDSEYGSKERVQEFIKKMAVEFGAAERIEFCYQATDTDLSEVSLVTNSGHLRPINRETIERLSPIAVISIMMEKWELRAEDIDLQACYDHGVYVVGVNEESSILNIFRYVGFLMLKMLFECGLTVRGSDILIISSDKFGETIKSVLDANEANTEVISCRDVTAYSTGNTRVDAVVIADHNYNGIIAGTGGLIEAEVLEKKFPDAKIVHLAGGVDTLSLKEKGVFCYPSVPGQPHRMSKTLSYLSINPVIELHALGLKSAEILVKARREGIPYHALSEVSCKNQICEHIDLK